MMDDGSNAHYTSRRKNLNLREWNDHLNNEVLNRDQINRVVMDYLVYEGYSEAVQIFSEETGTTYKASMDSVTCRDRVKRSLENGDIAEAIDTLNKFDKNTLETNPKIHFKLQQQMLVELIRNNQT
eukprot:TRINITY_DN2314_c0_g1_i1.p2 TRINITY_DN2314_c0_g1~~TRINITY_DN2314_c0_g1_i1.p2  ORF type:complete len:126 (+),score=17.54 TRINITY_DN2314_c0_g1_i1:151-528(+)